MSTPDTIDLFAERRNRVRNMLHTWLLATGSLALLAITAWAFGGTAGIVYAVIFGGVSMWAVRRISPQMVLSMYKAREVSAAEFPVGVRIITELARRAGLPATPRLHIIPSKMMNAFAVGRRERSAIAVTDALVRTLTTRELAGVLAHEISHVAHQDVKVMAFADMVARFTSVMSTVGIISLFLNIGSYASGNAGGVPWLAVVVLLAAPTIGGLLQMALSRTREFDADLGAALLTGDPDGLASALTRLERAQGRRWENILLPSGRIPDPSVLRSHPLTADRIARLNALKSTVGGGEDETFSRPEIGRPLPRRPSLVPRVRPLPHYGLFGVQAPSGEGEPLDLTGEGPASERPLNPAEGEPRIHFRRGAVWW